MDYVIRYDSDSTVGGKRVGLVYVQRVSDAIPGYPVTDACSYTKDIHEASRWSYDEGVECIRRGHWNRAELVLAGDAALHLPESRKVAPR